MKKKVIQRNKIDIAMANPFFRTAYEKKMTKQVNEVMDKALLKAELHAWNGEDKNNIIYTAGYVSFILIRAAGNQGISEDLPEIRIVLGMINALDDAKTGDIEQHRGSIKSGLSAAQRLLPMIKPFYLVESCLFADQAIGRGENLAIEKR